MKQIKNHRTGEIIFEGDFPSVRQCAEQAVCDGVCMDFADLSRINLLNASLDEASLRHALFCGANLTGANLSEADIDGADFSDAALFNTCLCFSSLRGCRFNDARFGAADIAGSSIDRSMFSTLSAFHLNFSDTHSMQGCIYMDPCGTHCAFSCPPLVVSGLPQPVIVMDHHVKIGSWLCRLDGPQALSGDRGNWLRPLMECFRPETLSGGARRRA